MTDVNDSCQRNYQGGFTRVTNKQEVSYYSA
jgi:hypothetical protein